MERRGAGNGANAGRLRQTVMTKRGGKMMVGRTEQGVKKAAGRAGLQYLLEQKEGGGAGVREGKVTGFDSSPGGTAMPH